MKLTIELEQEKDGRWIAEVPELGILLYGDTKDRAIRAAENAALEIIADKIQRKELPAAAAKPEFAIAA
jgi:predicted RNase H-like HicB family nuclease